MKRNDVKKIEFGFICGQFSVALSGNDLVLPGSKNQPLQLSLIPCKDPNDAAGYYTLEVRTGGSIVANIPVHAMWVTHESQPEPFLCLKADNSTELRDALAVYEGKAVELIFTPMENASQCARMGRCAALRLAPHSLIVRRSE